MGRSANAGPAVLRPARWAGTGRFAYRENTGPGCLRVLRGIQMSPCAVWQGSLTNGGSRFVTGRSGASCTTRIRASKKTVFPAEQLRLKLARHRARWKAHQGKVDQIRLVFIDETWIKTNMTPLRGWGSRRKRLIAHVPHGHWKTMTFLAALRHDRIDAPWVLDGPINGEAFKTYVRNELLKTLKPGDIVVLDNLGSHKGKAVRNMIRNAGAHLMFLPPYSSDLNPIEQVFAKIKHLMRRAMERTVETAQDRLVSVLDTIPPSECANYFSRAGYATT